MVSGNLRFYEGSLCLLTTLYVVFSSISELVSPTLCEPHMAHFYTALNNNWWLKNIEICDTGRDASVFNIIFDLLKSYHYHLRFYALHSLGKTSKLKLKAKQFAIIKLTNQALECVHILHNTVYR